jgi:hypothetical protein
MPADRSAGGFAIKIDSIPFASCPAKKKEKKKKKAKKKVDEARALTAAKAHDSDDIKSLEACRVSI